MPTPGDLLAKCRQLVKPTLVARIISPPPERPQLSAEHKAQMQAALQKLAADLAKAKSLRGPLEKRPGETDVDQARRLWPSHERKPA